MQYKTQPECTIFELGEGYDSLDTDALDEAGGILLTHAATVEPPCILLDFSKTNFIGSTFIEIMVRTWKRLNERGGTLAVCGLQPFCVDVLRVTKLETLWPSYATREEALKSFQD